MDTRKPGKQYVTCPKCGQGVRSEERLKGHLERCLATGQWRKKRSA